MPPISLKTSDRVFICGKTGSGKTYLAHYATRSINRLVVLDGKGSLSGWGLEPWNSDAERRLLSGEKVRARVLAPLGIDMTTFWNSVLITCYRAGNVTIYIDELYAVIQPQKPPSSEFFAVYTRGREFGIGVWATTQRPVWVPLVALSEAEHYFMFRLSLAEDRQRLASFMTEEVMSTIKDRYGFYYMYMNWDRPIYTEQLVIEEPKKVAVHNARPVEVPKAGRSRMRQVIGGGSNA